LRTALYRVEGLAGAGANDNAAICVMIAVWLAASWLIAAVISALMAAGSGVCAVPNVPAVPVVAAAATVVMGVIVVTVSSSVSSSCPSNTLYIFWDA